MSVVTVDTQEVEQRPAITALIRAARNRTADPNPHVIAQIVADELSDADLRAMAAHLLAAVVRQQIRNDRQQMFAPTDSPGVPHSAKWDQVQEARESGALQALRTSWHVGNGQWMFLADMRRTQLEFVRDDYYKRASENETWAIRFERLAAKAGRKKVGDLPHAVIEEALS